MEIRINDVLYTSLVAMSGVVDDAVAAFLTEWYSDADYVEGHTSGSTGEPKTVRLLKADMRASARLTNQYLNIDERSLLLLCLSPSYIAGKMMIVRAVEAKASLWVVKPSSTPLATVRRSVSLAAMVPMQVAATLQQSDGMQQLSMVDCLLVGGAPLSRETEQQLLSLPTTVYVTYGMTETVSHVALRRVGECCYKALGDVTFGADERDCLVIQAPRLSVGRLVTNDIVALKNDKSFEWKGRYDNVIMSGGLKFCAEVLEQKIATVISSRYYIKSAPDNRLGQRVVLVIEDKPYDDSRLSALREALARHLSQYEMPREICFMSHFEMTESGKVKRI